MKNRANWLQRRNNVWKMWNLEATVNWERGRVKEIHRFCVCVIVIIAPQKIFLFLLFNPYRKQNVYFVLSLPQQSALNAPNSLLYPPPPPFQIVDLEIDWLAARAMHRFNTAGISSAFLRPTVSAFILLRNRKKKLDYP